MFHTELTRECGNPSLFTPRKFSPSVNTSGISQRSKLGLPPHKRPILGLCGGVNSGVPKWHELTGGANFVMWKLSGKSMEIPFFQNVESSVLGDGRTAGGCSTFLGTRSGARYGKVRSAPSPASSCHFGTLFVHSDVCVNHSWCNRLSFLATWPLAWNFHGVSTDNSESSVVEPKIGHLATAQQVARLPSVDPLRRATRKCPTR